MNDRWIDRWSVTGTSNKTYVVARDREGNFGCDCPAWKFKKGTKVDCQHILRIRLELSIPGTNKQLVKEMERAKPDFSSRTRVVRLED